MASLHGEVELPGNLTGDDPGRAPDQVAGPRPDDGARDIVTHERWDPAMLTPVEVAREEEARQALGIAEIALLAEPIAGGWMAYDGPESWANEAAGLGLGGPVSDEELDRLVHFYASRGVSPRVGLCPFAHQSLVDGLARRGFVLKEFENVLVFDLTGELRPPRGEPADIVITRLDPADDDLGLAWADVSDSGFRPAGEPNDDARAAIALGVLRHPRCDGFAAWRAGRMVGAAGMETAGRAACLFGASVLPEHRRQSVQAALIVSRLLRARERGAAFACIHSKPGVPTERNALRLGFAVAYTKVALVLPEPGRARAVGFRATPRAG